MFDWTVIAKDMLVSFLLVIIPTIATLVGKFIHKKIEEMNNQKISALAGVLVKWAEDKFGPGNGDQKLDAAVSKLVELSKGKLTHEQADLLVRSTFQNLYGALSMSDKPEPIQTPVK